MELAARRRQHSQPRTAALPLRRFRDSTRAIRFRGILADGHHVNYAVKSSLLLSFLESVPDVAAKLKEPNTKDESFEDVVKSAQAAVVLVLVY
jgi:hypothetical protein